MRKLLSYPYLERQVGKDIANDDVLHRQNIQDGEATIGVTRNGTARWSDDADLDVGRRYFGRKWKTNGVRSIHAQHRRTAHRSGQGSDREERCGVIRGVMRGVGRADG